MPISHRTFPSRSLVLTVGRGEVTYAEARSYFYDLLADPDWRPGFRQLLDCTGVEDLHLSTQELRSLAGWARVNAPRLGFGV